MSREVSDAELAMVFGGSFVDDLTNVGKGIAVIAGAAAAVAAAPAATPVIILYGIAIGGGIAGGAQVGNGLGHIIKDATSS